MNNITRLIRAFGFAVVVLSGIGASFALEAPVRILPLGDSLTSGTSIFTVQGAYRNRLYALLANAGYNVDFVGTYSDTSNPGLPDVNHQGAPGFRIDQVQTSLAGWLNAVEDPDVVLLLIGTNDFWQNFQVSGAQTRLSSLLADIATKRPYAKIIVATLPPRTDDPSIEARQVAYNAAIPGIAAQQVALGRQVTFVDMHAAMTAADISSDGVHPSATGYDKMGDAWFPAITGVITPQGTANPPMIARIGPMVDLTHVSVVFSKPVADDAASLANFSLSGGITISNATLDAATKRTVTLTTSTQAAGLVYSLSVSGVRDRTALHTVIAPGSMVNFSWSAITNGSFENDVAGWTRTGNQEIKSSSPYAATNGTKLVAFNTGQLTPNGTLSQTVTTTVGQTYQLSFDVGVFAYNFSPQRLQVAVQGSSALLSDITSLNGVADGACHWVPKSYSFVANSATTTLTFTDLSTTSNSLDLLLDNVQLGAQSSRTLSVTSTPAGGAGMTVSPSDNSGNGNGNTGLIRSYNDGATVSVTAPATYGGNNFLRWQKDGVDLSGSPRAITITLDASHSLNAVYGANTAPVAVADSYAVSTNSPLLVPAGGVLTNDTDADGSALTAVLNTSPLHGTLALNPDGGFVYTPTSGFEGSDSFSYHANDGVANSNVVTVALTVAPGPTLLIVNGSFESNLTGWTPTGNMEIRTGAPYFPTNGSKLLAFNASQLTPNGILSQTFATVSGQTYQLTFDAGVLAFNTNTQSMKVEVTGTSSLLSQTINLTGLGGGANRWVAQSFAFVANSTTTTLTFRDLSASTGSIDLLLDNVAVNTAGAVTTRTLTVSSTPATGVGVTVSPVDNSSNGNGSTQFTRTYNDGTSVTLTAPAGFGGNNFSKWRKNGTDLSVNAITSVTMDADYTLTAVYVAAPPVGSFVNGSFESGLTGWTTAGSTNTVVTDSSVAGTNGTTLVKFNSSNSPNDGVLSQAFTTTPGTSYNVTFDMGLLSYNFNQQRLEVSATGSSSLLSQTFTMTGTGGGAVTFSPKTASFVANSATTTLTFRDLSASTGSIDLLLDNVNVNAAGVVTTRTLTVTSTPATGAGITVSPADNSSNGNGNTQFTRTYNDGTAVTLTAPAGFGGNVFSKWRKNGTDLTTNSGASVTMDADYTLTAVYVAAPPVGSFANGSFESGLTGWTTAGSTNTVVTDSSMAGTNGTTLVKFNSSNSPNDGVVSQAFTTTPGTSYNVTFDMGLLSYNFNQQRLEVSAMGSSSLLSQTFTMTGTSGGAVTFSPKTASFVANSATTTLTFRDVSTSTGSIDLLLDNVNVSAAGVVTTRTLTVTSTPATGAGITVSPADNSSNANGSTQFTRTYYDGTAVTLTAPAGFGGNVFSKWRKNGTDLSVNAITSVTMDADYTLTAVYVAAPPVGAFVNGGFESGITGWTASGSTNSVALDTGLSGTNATSLVKFNSGNSATDGVLSQTFTTIPGTSYTVTFEMGVLAYNTSPQLIQVSATGTSSLISQTFSMNGIGGGAVIWSAKTINFTADSATTTLTFRDQSTTGSGLDLLLDNVNVILTGSTATLTVNSLVATGVSITVSPADLGGSGNGSTQFTRLYGTGTNVTLTAPAFSGSNAFVKWRKDGVDITTNTSTTVTMDTGHTLTAVYQASTVAPGLLYNGSFEYGYAGWNITGFNCNVEGSAPYVPTNGTKVFTCNSSNRTPNAVISQTFTTTPGATYVLAFDFGAIGYTGDAQNLRVALTGSGSLLSQTLTANSIGGGATNWTARSFTFVANSASTTLTFSDVSTVTLLIDMVLDNVRINLLGSSPPTRTLTVNSTPANGAGITLSPADISTNGSGNTPFTRSYSDGTTVSLTAPATYGGNYFVKWQKNGIDFNTTTSVVLALDADYTFTAVYSPTPPVAFINGSFENGFTGWSFSGSPGTVKTNSYLTGSNGTTLIEFNTDQTPNDGVLYQTFPTTPGATYTVTFDMGILSYNFVEQRMNVSATGTSLLVSQTFTIAGTGVPAATFSTKTVSFTANSTSTTLTFRDASTTTDSLDLLLDYVRVTKTGGAAAIAPPTGDSYQNAADAAVTASATGADPGTLGNSSLDGTPGAFRIGFNATEGGLYILERSEDLKNWNYHSEILVTEPGPIEFQDNDPPKARMFYRIGKALMEAAAHP